jgi:hypothetical protein
LIICGRKRSSSDSDIETSERGNGRFGDNSNNGSERNDKEELSRMLSLGSNTKPFYAPLPFINDHQSVSFK